MADGGKRGPCDSRVGPAPVHPVGGRALPSRCGTLSAAPQAGHVSPAAHSTKGATDDLQTRQRTRSRCTMMPRDRTVRRADPSHPARKAPSHITRRHQNGRANVRLQTNTMPATTQPQCLHRSTDRPVSGSRASRFVSPSASHMCELPHDYCGNFPIPEVAMTV